MRSNKVAELLKSIDSKDLKKLKSFLALGYFNRSMEITGLFNFLKKKNFDPDSIHYSDALAKEIFGKKINKYRFNRVLNEFTQLIYTFLINEFIKNNENIKLELLLKILFKKKVFNNTLDILNYLKSINNSKEDLKSSRYRRNYLIEKYRNELSFVSLLYSREKAFQKMSDSADKYFILEKLKAFIMAAKQNRQTTLGADYKLSFKQEITDHISRNENFFKNEEPLIYCYYLSLKMNEEKNGIKFFNQFKKYFFSIIEKLNIDELKDLLMDYKDNCDDRTLINRERFGNEVVQAYILMDKKDLFTTEGFISNIDFMNAIITGLSFNNKWAVYFFDKYRSLLQEPGKDDIIHLVKANILLHEKKYSESLTELSLINSREFYYYLRIRLLRIKIFFELNDTESLMYIIDSVKHYIKRKRSILGVNFLLVNNFMNSVLKLLKLRNNYNKTFYRSFSSSLKDEEAIYAKDWIIVQLQQVNK
jgi:hypothetical protein